MTKAKLIKSLLSVIPPVDGERTTFLLHEVPESKIKPLIKKLRRFADENGMGFDSQSYANPTFYKVWLIPDDDVSSVVVEIWQKIKITKGAK